jgi:hypothetical protein
MIHGTWHQRHWGKEGADHGGGGHGSWPFLRGDLLVMVTEIQADLPLDHDIWPHCGGQDRPPGRVLRGDQDLWAQKNPLT